MNTFNVLTSATDDNFLARAFAEYAKDKQEAYANMYRSFTEAVAKANDIDDVQTFNGSSQVDEILDEMLSDIGVSDESMMQIMGKAVNIRSFTKDFIENQLSDTGEDISSIVGTLDGVEIQLDDVLSDMKETLHSISVISAASIASLANDTSAKLTIFRDNVSRTFGNAYSDISGSLGYVTDMLTISVSPSDFIKGIFRSTGLNNENSIEQNTEFYKYTGSSPSAAFNFDSLASGLATTVKGATKIVADVAKGFLKIGKGIFNKAKTFIVEAAINPYDIEDTKQIDADLTIDGFALVSSGVTREAFPSSLERMKGQTFQFDLISATVLIEYEDVIQPSGFINFKKSIKPKPIKIDPNYEFGYDNKFTVNQFISYLSDLKDNGLEYADASDDEITLYKSFNNGLFMTKVINTFLGEEMRGVMNTVVNDDNLRTHWKTVSSVGNLDFIKVAMGTKDFDDLDGLNRVIPGMEFGYDTMMSHHIDRAIEFQFNERDQNPLEYTFIPYVSKTVQQNNSRYRIKTDAENSAYFTKMLNIAIIAVVVVTISLVAITTISKIGRKSQLKAAAMKREMEGKALNGELTSKDLRRLKKAQRKASIFGSANEGLVSNGLGDVFGGNTDVISLING